MRNKYFQEVVVGTVLRNMVHKGKWQHRAEVVEVTEDTITLKIEGKELMFSASLFKESFWTVVE